ncbi:hypothetical protein ACF09E_03035 [Streptomyces sp. NPDC014891]|uniref:hypothetical protein n=1 Tax=Streptomyces sp. NPDC014891 TaxID=3364929 RepID=UPI0036FBDC63
MGDRFGEVLLTSMAVLFVEAVVAVPALVVWGDTQEAPGPTYNPLGILLLSVLFPLGAGVGAALSLGLVMPLLAAAEWLGRRTSAGDVWWWVPTLAAAGAAVPVLVLAVLAEAGPVAALAGWLAAVAALTAPALAARVMLLPRRPRLSVPAMFGRVALYGTLAVVTAFTLAGIALYAGVGYEPPRLSAARVAGTWSDGRGGTLTLAADGRATTTRVETFDHAAPFEPRVRPCTGAGTWTYDPGTGPASQRVTVSVDGCTMDDWLVSGDAERPKLYVTYGDPDEGHAYILLHDGR